jgi:acyl homoserine lactone synthase
MGANMLRYVYANDLHLFPVLRDSMFRDRADQFHVRLGWNVQVNDKGWEHDAYDGLNPLYVIWEVPGGRHGGSMRFLPTIGQTMVNDHFLDLTDGVAIRSPFIWECTRFCLAPKSDSRIAAALMLAGGELMRAFHLTHFVGVFDARMVRIYRMIGAVPDVLGSQGAGRDQVSVGLWAYSHADRARVLHRAGISSAVSEAWFDRSFGPILAEQMTA